jgi:hypothetical protein
MLQGPLTALLAALCAAQWLTWAPQYLTWPWWADHDVFASAAHAWDLGLPPYREARTNQFPGTIYLFWGLGRAFGWGKTPPLYAVDAALVASLGWALAAWGRARFRSALPGLVAYASFLAYYLSLDYTQTAQRDWHAPFFAAIALLALETWPNRVGRIVSAASFAVALAIRPQVVLFGPAILLALDQGARRKGEPRPATIKVALAWAALAGALFLASFSPLVIAGVWGDFLRGVGMTAFGGRYYQARSLPTFLREWLTQISFVRFSAVMLALGLLAARADSPSRRTALTWIAALAAVSLYRPLSPLQHAYLSHPITLVWSVTLGVLAGLLLERSEIRADFRLIAVLLVLGLEATGKPRFSSPTMSLRAIPILAQGKEPEIAPLGYTPNPTVRNSAIYDWKDYCDLLRYLRTEVPPTTRIANALKGVPALVGSTEHLSAFPAESVAWLRMIQSEDEGAFAEALERTPDSVVIWAPREVGSDRFFQLKTLDPAIRWLYEPAAKFGAIEVWRRKPSEPTSG